MANKGRPPKLAGQEDQVVSMYLGGATIGDIEKHFDVGDKPIIRILDAAGVKRRIGRPSGRPGGTPSVLPAPVTPDPTVPDVRAPEKTPERPDGRAEARYRVPSTGPRAPKRVQDEVFRRDGYRCRICGARTRLTVEFAIPPERGGDPKDPKDLRTVCAACLVTPLDAPRGKKGILRRILGR